jgi:holo-[acyl-carrier protein] synthase
MLISPEILQKALQLSKVMEQLTMPDSGKITNHPSGIFGIGIDIVEVKRVRIAIERNRGFLEKVFTPGEIEYCRSKKNPVLIFASYAHRFAAKEAVLKAFGVGVLKGIGLDEIEVLNDDGGRPLVCLSGNADIFSRQKNISRIEISLSGIKEFAAAFAMVFQ